MNKIIRQILCLLLFAHVHTLAIIFESNNLQDISKYIDKKSKGTQETIVIFDIDHTIAELPIDLDTWIPNNIARLQQKGLSKEDAVSFTLNLYFTLQNFLELTPIGNSCELIKKLQKQNIPVMALTNRSIVVAKRTISQFSQKDIDLSIKSPIKKTLEFPVTYNCRFSHGILFVASNDKGRALFAFFEKAHIKPKKIIFVDDKEKYLISVEKEAKKRNIEFVGMRFSLQDKKKKAFDFDKVEQQICDLKAKIGIDPIQIASKKSAKIKTTKIASNKFAVGT